MPANERPWILVTGSSGLIGAALCNDLIRDHHVVGLDLEPPAADYAHDYHWIECDLTKNESVTVAMQKVRELVPDSIASVVHLAAYYDFSGEPSPLYEELTVEGTRRLLRALQTFKVKQLVFTSTLLVMKPAEKGGVLTEDSPVRAEWDYPESKLETERLLVTEHGDVPIVILRLAGVYDEEGHSPPITQQLVRILDKNLESYFFPGNPDHGQPFIHIDDTVAALRATIEHQKELAPVETLLLAEPELLTYAQLQDRLGELVHGKEWPTLRIPAPIAKAGAWMKDKFSRKEQFIKPWMIDLADAHYPVRADLAYEKLGFVPRHRLSDTLPSMVDNLMRDPDGFRAKNGLSEKR